MDNHREKVSAESILARSNSRAALPVVQDRGAVLSRPSFRKDMDSYKCEQPPRRQYVVHQRVDARSQCHLAIHRLQRGWIPSERAPTKAHSRGRLISTVTVDSYRYQLLRLGMEGGSPSAERGQPFYIRRYRHASISRALSLNTAAKRHFHIIILQFAKRCAVAAQLPMPCGDRITDIYSCMHPRSLLCTRSATREARRGSYIRPRTEGRLRCDPGRS